jgi:hypothetical protein
MALLRNKRQSMFHRMQCGNRWDNSVSSTLGMCHVHKSGSKIKLTIAISPSFLV